jgi:hypothetical protein
VEQSSKPRLRFAVIGINHNHINSQVGAVLRGGGELVWLYAREPDLVKDFQKRFPQAKLARSEDEVLQDSSIQLVLSSAIPAERAPIGIRVMQHGKDYMSDKPGITTLEQLAEVKRVQAQTRRIYSIMYSERFENQATIRAAELVKAGAIGHVVQTIGLGPHRMAPATRPAWFFEKPRYGGILCDIASHPGRSVLVFHWIDALPRSSRRRWATSTSRSIRTRGLRRHDRAEGDRRCRVYSRRLVHAGRSVDVGRHAPHRCSGPTGFIEVRKNVDIAGRPGESHLFLVDQKETPLHRLLEGAVVLWRAAGERRPQPHRDRDDAGALLSGDGTRAQGAAAGAATAVQGLTGAQEIRRGCFSNQDS